MSLVQTTIRGTGWQFGSLATQAILQVGVVAILARYVTPEEYGLMGIALIVIAFGRMFSEVGLIQALVQKKEVTDKHVQTAFSTSLLLGVIFTVALWTTAPFVAGFFQSPAAIPVLRVISFSFLAIGFGMVAQALIQKNLKFKQWSIIEVTSFVVGYAIVGVTLAIFGYGVWALVFAFLAQESIRSFLYLYFYPHNFSLVFSKREFKELFSFGSGYTLTRLFNTMANKGDGIIVGKFLGPHMLGIYDRASYITHFLAQLIGLPIDKTLFPTMSTLQNNKERLKIIHLNSISLAILTFLPISIMMTLMAPEFILALLGKQWIEAIKPLQILMLIAPLRIATHMIDSLVRALGAVYQSAARKAVFALSLFSFAYVGHFWGLSGVAIGVGGAIVLNYIMMTQLSYKLTKFTTREYISALYPSFLLGVITLISTFVVLSMSRQYLESHIASLVVTSFVLLAILSIFLLWYPRLFGATWCWFLTHCVESIVPKRILAGVSRVINNRTRQP